MTPVHAALQLETRGETHEVNAFLVESVRRTVEGVAAAYGVEARMDIAGEATTLLTTPAGVNLLAEAAREVFGTESVEVRSSMTGSEDCTTLMRRAVEKGADGAFLIYGCTKPFHHKPTFDVDETTDLLPGLAVLANVVCKTNG